MCQETVTIAICASQNPPARSATCGKLHLIAAQRDTCNNAQGPCVCFFGTCGNVARRINNSGVDIADLTKLRCASCTNHEDATGERRTGREFIESPLLKKNLFTLDDETAIRDYYATLQDYWAGEPSCPYHENINSATAIETAADDVVLDSNPPPTSVNSYDRDELASIDKENAEDATISVSSTDQDPEHEATGALTDLNPSPDVENAAEPEQDMKEDFSAPEDSSNDTTPSSLQSSPSSTRYVSTRRDMSEALENPKIQDAVRKIAIAKAFLTRKVDV